MLTMGKLYDALKTCDETMRMNKMDFFSYFIPADMESAWDLFDRLKETASYRSMFFTGNTDRRGLDEKIEKVMVEFQSDSDALFSEVLATATTFLESYGQGDSCERFKRCLNLLEPEIQSEPALNNYVASRKENPDSYADIFTVLYLYAMTLWKKSAFLKLLSTRYKNGASEEWTFDLKRVGLYADCGKEKTIFKTSIIEKHGIPWLDVQVDFSPNLIRPEIPNWCSVVFSMRPPRDIRYFNALSFRIFPVCDLDGSDGTKTCGLDRLMVEVKPENRWQIRHHTHPVEMKKGPQVGTIYLKDVNPEILKQFEELCFVVNLNDLPGIETGNPESLRAHFQIAQVRLN